MGLSCPLSEVPYDSSSGVVPKGNTCFTERCIPRMGKEIGRKNDNPLHTLLTNSCILASNYRTLTTNDGKSCDVQQTFQTLLSANQHFRQESLPNLAN